MIKNAEEARACLEKEEESGMIIRLDRAWEAVGYLRALKGPEVMGLVAQLQKILEEIEDERKVGGKHIGDRQEIIDALSIHYAACGWRYTKVFEDKKD